MESAEAYFHEQGGAVVLFQHAARAHVDVRICGVSQKALSPDVHFFILHAGYFLLYTVSTAASFTSTGRALLCTSVPTTPARLRSSMCLLRVNVIVMQGKA